jgi:hypothetical protein
VQGDAKGENERQQRECICGREPWKRKMIDSC